jgi:RimJ/RimL family protein N-acetyltransferase
MILETPRSILRPFAAGDLDRMAELMANKDFMRFSTAASPARTPMTREQTQSFLDKVIGWDREGSAITIRHDCAVERHSRWLLRFLSSRSRRQNGN